MLTGEQVHRVLGLCLCQAEVGLPRCMAQLYPVVDSLRRAQKDRVQFKVCVWVCLWWQVCVLIDDTDTTE